MEGKLLSYGGRGMSLDRPNFPAKRDEDETKDALEIPQDNFISSPITMQDGYEEGPPETSTPTPSNEEAAEYRHA